MEGMKGGVIIVCCVYAGMVGIEDEIGRLVMGVVTIEMVEMKGVFIGMV